MEEIEAVLLLLVCRGGGTKSAFVSHALRTLGTDHSVKCTIRTGSRGIAAHWSIHS